MPNNICFANQKYFKTPSPSMYYTLGVMLCGYVPHQDEGVLYRSHQRSLVELVRNQLDSNCEIISDPRPRRSSHWFAISHAPELRKSLEDLGVRGDKHHQHLPSVPSQYRSHFARGVLDDSGRVYVYKPNKVEVAINVRGNITFMKEFHSLLKQEAGVRDRIIQNDHELTYRDRDTAAIAHWIYQDPEIITEEGIYLPEKEKIYSQGMNPPPRKMTEKSRQLREKMERAKRMMREGRTFSDIVTELGYAFQSGFSIAFRKTQNMTPTQFMAASRTKRD